MDNDRVKGKFDDLKGDVKKKVGEATDDKELQGEGMLDKAKGKVENAFGKLKDEGRAERDRINHDDKEDVA